MSRYLSQRLEALAPYVPGEQPQDKKYIKLNTNESPYPPAERVLAAAKADAARCNLYSDPECKVLTDALAARYGVEAENVLATNGSDEILNFAFMAFCDENTPIAFPDITYGFYSVFGDLYHIPCRVIPLDADLAIRVEDYENCGSNVVIANPNAPTGRYLPLDAVERIVSTNPGHVVIVDEAYIDFGGETAVPLIKKYNNLLVTGTFSKSRSLAGARVGFGIGDKALIDDLKRVKFSTNPYNVNRMSAAAATAALEEDALYMARCAEIARTRTYVTASLEALGFEVIPSLANFIFAKSDRIDGETLYRKLKAGGILVRHFAKERIAAYNRITVGTKEQMDAFLSAVKEILSET